jgi:hypothetical protein
MFKFLQEININASTQFYSSLNPFKQNFKFTSWNLGSETRCENRLIWHHFKRTADPDHEDES